MSLWGIVLAAVLAAVAAALVVPTSARARSALPPSLPPSPSPSLPPSPSSSSSSKEGLARFRVVLSCVAGAGAAAVLGGWIGIGIGFAAAVTVWQVVTRMEAPATRRRREQLMAAMPHVVDLLASSMSAGSSPSSALEMVARAVEPPMREELLLVTSRLGLGTDPVRVWTGLGQHPQLAPLGRCLARTAESGAPVCEAMFRLGEDLRRESRADVENRARAVGVKAAAPLGLCLLPAFILVGIVPLVVGSIGAVLQF